MSGYPYGTVSVGTTATFVCTVAPVNTDAVIKNRGPETIYVGGDTSVTADASSTGGFPLEPGESLTLPPCPTTVSGLDVYAITAARSSVVSQINV